MKILILDAGNSNTLAIIRYLSRYDSLNLSVAGYGKYSLAFYSKYISGKFILPNPRDNKGEFLTELIKILKEERFDVLLPVGFYSFNACIDGEKEISKLTSVTLPTKESFDIAASKTETYRLAEQLGIPYPKTFYLSKIEDAENLNLNYPAVIKAPKEMGKNVVEYIHTKKELISKLKRMCDKYHFTAPDLPVVQEYIRGGGYGFFAMYDNGVCKNIFMHKRIREYPASGGASVCAESFFDEDLKKYGMKMLDALKWNGVAMVEFKKDEIDGQYKLMEINPKFWGSLELALAAGVNFPYYLIQKAKGESLNYSEQFDRIKFHWLLNGELFHFFSRPASFFSQLKDLFTAKNDVWLRDPLPNLFQIVNIFAHYYKKLKGK